MPSGVGGSLFAPPRPDVAQHAAELHRAGQTKDGRLVDVLANTPTAVWLGEWSGDIGKAITAAIAAAGQQTVVFVLYMVPSRDLGQYSSGGADNDDEYLRTIRRAASALA